MPQTARRMCRVLLLTWLLWLSHAAMAADPGADLLRTLSTGTRSDHALAQRVVSALHKLDKTLILERTRGAKDIDVYRHAAPAVVLVVTNEGFGSGALINSAGHILTNWHVVRDHPQVVVMFKPKDGTALKKELAFRATVEKVDHVTDLALLKIDMPPKAFASLPLGDVSALAVGQDVHAIGHPAGEVWTYTKGIISQIRANYRWSTSDGRVYQAKVIQTQTPVNPGNSGGPLLDDSGRLVGVNSFRGQGEGLNYAVAVDEIQDFLKREGGRASPPQQPPGVAQGEPRCTEPYDTKGQGWTDIVGCYYASTTPPPDLWAVTRSPKGPLAYVAFDSRRMGQIDTVIKSRDPQWQSLEYYIDTNCSGTVALIAHQRMGSAGPDSYRLPEKPMRLVTFAKELDGALKKKKIPYLKLRVCQ